MNAVYDLAGRAEEVDEFVVRWHAFVAAWSGARRKQPDRAARLLDSALADGLPPVEGDVPPPDEQDELTCARAVVARGGYVDEDGYATANRLTVGRDDEPLIHFCREGWRDLRAPSLDFDLWWYWTEYLDPTREAVNPCVHHALEGRRRGLATVPPRPPERVPSTVDRSVRRICLYAAYDRDGLVDPYVVDYLSELSRFADVYYLADGVLDPGELEKVAAVTRGAWSIPHAAYDFGSFSMLARDLVGWDVIDGYDELLLANDSCYLVRPLDEVFARMDARPCDWWSLQATSMLHPESYTEDDSPIPLHEAKRRFIGPRQWTDVHYLHLSSYFLTFRRAVHRDPGFRWRLDTVSPQRDKQMVVHKYEVGISRYLMDNGYDFDTFVDGLYAFHPLYSRHVFELVEQGFPLIKRNFLAENPKHVVGLEDWPTRLRAVVPDAPVETMAANIARVSPADRLAVAYDVSVVAGGTPRAAERALFGYALRVRDKETGSHAHWWGFPVSARSHRLDPGARAVLEQVRDDPSIHKVILTRSRHVEFSGTNVAVLPLTSRRGQEALIRCGRVFIDDEPRAALPYILTERFRTFVHLGVGVPLLPSGPDGPDRTDWEKVAVLAVSSPAEALVRAAGTPRVDLSRTWATGLPRHDLLVSAAVDLPEEVAAEERRLRARLDGRRLLVWWFDGPLSEHTAAELAWLDEEWCRRHDVVIGVRDRRVDGPRSVTRALGHLGIIGLSDRHLHVSSVAHRLASAVVTDGSPEAFDSLVRGTPVLLLGSQRSPGGTAVEARLPEELVPGTLRRCTDVEELRSALTELLPDSPVGAGRTLRDGTLPGADLLDGHAAWRLTQGVRRLVLR